MEETDYPTDGLGGERKEGIESRDRVRNNIFFIINDDNDVRSLPSFVGLEIAPSPAICGGWARQERHCSD